MSPIVKPMGSIVGHFDGASRYIFDEQGNVYRSLMTSGAKSNPAYQLRWHGRLARVYKADIAKVAKSISQ